MNAPKRKFESVLAKTEAATTGAEAPSHAEIAAAVDQVADQHNVGSIVRPSDAPRVVPESVVTPLRRVKKVMPAPTTKSTMELPTYLMQEIALKSAKGEGTKRYLVLKAFKDAGYTVNDIDLYKDGRRGNE